MIARRAARIAALLLASLLGACAVAPLDREMLITERAPTVVLEGARGPLSHAQSEKILADLKRRSPETSIFDRHVAVEENVAGNPLSVGNKATLLEDGAATYASMLAAIKGARNHIHIETYIFEDDDIGREFARALVAKRKAGVKVRVMFDSVGSIGTPRAFFKDMVDQGIEVVEYNPVKSAAALTEGLQLNHRDHRKLTIVDGRIAFLGGINISGVYTQRGSGGSAGSSPGSGASGGKVSPGASAKSKERDDIPFEQRPWRDTQVRLEGPVVADFQRAFVKNWEAQAKEKIDDKDLFPKLQAQGPQIVRAIPSSPDSGPNALYIALISAIESAETEVRLTVAYFVPHEELLAALKRAAERGVVVKMILPSRTDNWLVFNAGRSYYEDLLEAGVHIYERKTRLLHSKTATIDGVWATIGSTNLDWRSLVFNDELNAVILGPEFASQLNAVFDKDIAQSTEITHEAWANRSLEDRLRELAARAWARAL